MRAFDQIAQNNRTTAVLSTQEGVTIIGSGKHDMTRYKRAELLPGEMKARLPGQDAEITVLQARLTMA